jgi:hypothetical protein
MGELACERLCEPALRLWWDWSFRHQSCCVGLGNRGFPIRLLVSRRQTFALRCWRLVCVVVFRNGNWERENDGLSAFPGVAIALVRRSHRFSLRRDGTLLRGRSSCEILELRVESIESSLVGERKQKRMLDHSSLQRRVRQLERGRG